MYPILPASRSGNTSTLAFPATGLPGALDCPISGTIAASNWNSPSSNNPSGAFSLAILVASTTLSTSACFALPFEEYLERISNGNFDAYLGGTRFRNVYDFDALLSENGALNNYGYKSEYIEMALDALNTAPGQDSLSDAVFKLEELFVREQPVIGLLFKNRTLLVAENVNGDILPSVNAPYKNIDRW